VNDEADQAPRAAEDLETEVGGEPRRRFMGASAAGGAVSLFVFIWLLTAGTFDLGRSSFSSNFYDVQAKAFLAGKLSMPASVLSIEGITIHGRSYMYFGPFLAVLHLPFVGIDGSLSGHLSGTSMVAAFVIALIGLSRLLWRARPLTGRDGQVAIGEMVFVAVAILGMSAGSILLYLGSDTSVYQETELWAIALAILSVSVGMDLLTAPTRRRAVGLAALCLSVCMVRLVVGLGVLALTLLVGAAQLASRYLREHRDGASRLLSDGGLAVDDPRPGIGIGLLASAIGTLGIYSVINEAKFGSAFGLPLKHQALAVDGLSGTYASYAATHSSFNSLSFLPTTLTWYLRPDALDITRLFPFVNFPPRIWVVGAVRFAGLNPSSSLSATMPVLMVLALIGVGGLLLPRRCSSTAEQGSLLRRFRPMFLAMAIACVGTLTYAGIANRHLGDLFPALVVVATAGAAVALRWLKGRRIMMFTVCVVASLGLGASIWINLGLGLINQRIASTSIPGTERASFARFRISTFHAMFSGPLPQVTRGGPVPKKVPLGWLYVSTGCTGLYQAGQGVWHGIERTNAAGHFRVEVTLPSPAGRQVLPLLVSGTTPGSVDLIGIRVLPGGRYQIAYLSENYGKFFSQHEWSDSTVQQAPSSRQVQLDVTIDPSPHVELRQAEVVVDGRSILEKRLEVHANDVQTVGMLPASLATDPEIAGPVAPRFPGGIRQLPVPRSVCSSLR
jgi:hypothetical protein